MIAVYRIPSLRIWQPGTASRRLPSEGIATGSGKLTAKPGVHKFRKMVAIDFFTVPTIRFQVLYVFLVLAQIDGGSFISTSPHIRRPSGAHNNCARHFHFDQVHRYLPCDRDRIF